MPPRVDARRLIAWVAAAHAVLLAIAAAVLWVRVFYFGDLDAVLLLSYRSADVPGSPPTPIVPWMLGVHSFGDFLWPFMQALRHNPWTDPTAPNGYPPVLVLVFKLFTLLKYVVAVAIFLALNALSMILPVAVSARRIVAPVAVLAVALLVVLSFPFGMVIDRGNAQGLLVVPLYLFAAAWRTGRWRRATLALALAVSLKLYPALIAIALLGERRWREAVAAVAFALAATLLLFFVFPGAPMETMRGFLDGVFPFSAPGPARFTFANYSIAGMVANATAAAAGMSSASFTWTVSHPWLFGIAYLVPVAAIASARRLPFVVRLACTLSVLAFVIPLSYGYTLCFIYIVVGEMLRIASTGDSDGDLPVPLACALVVAVTATLAPWPYALPVTGSSIGTLIVPAAWLILAATALITAYGGRSGRRWATTTS